MILCTGFSEKITQKKAETMGIKAFLTKPLLKEEMAHTVRRVLDERGTRDERRGTIGRKTRDDWGLMIFD